MPAGRASGSTPAPRLPARLRDRGERLFDALHARYPDARCELNFRNPHELLIATILSAQSTDAGVNRATPGLFEAFPSPEAFARAEPEEVQPYIRTIGLYRNKSRAIVESMRAVVERYQGEVPRTMDDLLTLRGVARKTANVVLGNAFGINEGVVVDTHVARLSARFGLTPASARPEKIEQRLMAMFPRDRWTLLPHLFIFHGRRVCKARGGGCAEDAICVEFCSNARGRSGGTLRAR